MALTIFFFLWTNGIELDMFSEVSSVERLIPDAKVSSFERFQ